MKFGPTLKWLNPCYGTLQSHQTPTCQPSAGDDLVATLRDNLIPLHHLTSTVMGLCSQCQSFSHPSFYENALKPGGKLESIVIAQTGEDLAAAAATCTLCALFYEGLLHDSQRHGPGSNGPLRANHILLKPKIDPFGLSFPETAAEGIALFGFTLTTTETTSGAALRCIVRLHSEGSRRWIFTSV